MSQDLIRIASFDIGKKNFCFYIEEIDREQLLALKNVPATRRYNPNGTPTAKMQELLEEVFANGETILHINLNLTENCDKKLRLDPETFHNMNDALDEYLDYFDDCVAFVIEQQMSFRGKINPMAMKLGQHCYSYFTFKYGRTKQFIEFPAYHKTQVLGAPKVPGKKNKKGGFRWKTLGDRDRKKWSIDKAVEILTSRGELDVLEGLTTVSKRDDLADTLTQLQAFKYLAFVEKKL